MQSLDLQQLELVFYLLLGLIVVTLGALVAYVVIANRRQRARLAKTYELESLAPRPALQITGQILSLVREEPGAPLQVEIGGKRYRRMEEIQDTQLRRQVVEAAMELVAFTGALAGGGLGPAPLDQTQTWREDLRQDSESELQRIRSSLSQQAGEQQASPASRPPVTGEAEEQFLSSLADTSQPSSLPERPSLLGALQRRRAPKVPDSGQPQTFVDQIDNIVQRRVQLMPALAQRGLHVRPGVDGGVRFVFEDQEYENLDDLPNLTARQVIKDAIQEWDETA